MNNAVALNSPYICSASPCLLLQVGSQPLLTSTTRGSFHSRGTSQLSFRTAAPCALLRTSQAPHPTSNTESTYPQVVLGDASPIHLLRQRLSSWWPAVEMAREAFYRDFCVPGGAIDTLRAEGEKKTETKAEADVARTPSSRSEKPIFLLHPKLSYLTVFQALLLLQSPGRSPHATFRLVECGAMNAHFSVQPVGAAASPAARYSLRAVPVSASLQECRAALKRGREDEGMPDCHTVRVVFALRLEADEWKVQSPQTWWWMPKEVVEAAPLFSADVWPLSASPVQSAFLVAQAVEIHCKANDEEGLVSLSGTMDHSHLSSHVRDLSLQLLSYAAHQSWCAAVSEAVLSRVSQQSWCAHLLRDPRRPCIGSQWTALLFFVLNGALHPLPVNVKETLTVLHNACTTPDAKVCVVTVTGCREEMHWTTSSQVLSCDAPRFRGGWNELLSFCTTLQNE